MADFNQAILLNPMPKPMQAGALKVKMNNYGDANDDLTKAIILNPQYAEAWLSNRAEAKLKLQDSDGAMADFTKAISADPKSSMAYHDRGCVKLAMNDFNEAIADFNKAIEIKRFCTNARQ